MSEIRSWAAGALAVVAIAVGTGAGVQIARTSEPVTPVAAVHEDEGPVIFGRSAADAYRGCVRSDGSPGPAACRRLVDAGVRGE